MKRQFVFRNRLTGRELKVELVNRGALVYQKDKTTMVEGSWLKIIERYKNHPLYKEVG